MIVKAGEILGVKLPIGLLLPLKIRNGGYILGFAHSMKQRTTWAEDHTPQLYSGTFSYRDLMYALS